MDWKEGGGIFRIKTDLFGGKFTCESEGIIIKEMFRDGPDTFFNALVATNGSQRMLKPWTVNKLLLDDPQYIERSISKDDYKLIKF